MIGNTGPGPSATNKLSDLFAAYDGLPVAVREALAAARFNWSPIEIKAALAAGLTPERIIQIIKRGDITMAKTEP